MAYSSPRTFHWQATPRQSTQQTPGWPIYNFRQPSTPQEPERGRSLTRASTNTTQENNHQLINNANSVPNKAMTVGQYKLWIPNRSSSDRSSSPEIANWPHRISPDISDEEDEDSPPEISRHPLTLLPKPQATPGHSTRFSVPASRKNLSNNIWAAPGSLFSPIKSPSAAVMSPQAGGMQLVAFRSPNLQMEKFNSTKSLARYDKHIHGVLSPATTVHLLLPQARTIDKPPLPLPGNKTPAHRAVARLRPLKLPVQSPAVIGLDLALLPPADHRDSEMYHSPRSSVVPKTPAPAARPTTSPLVAAPAPSVTASPVVWRPFSLVHPTQPQTASAPQPPVTNVQETTVPFPRISPIKTTLPEPSNTNESIPAKLPTPTRPSIIPLNERAEIRRRTLSSQRVPQLKAEHSESESQSEDDRKKLVPMRSTNVKSPLANVVVKPHPPNPGVNTSKNHHQKSMSEPLASLEVKDIGTVETSKLEDKSNRHVLQKYKPLPPPPADSTPPTESIKNLPLSQPSLASAAVEASLPLPVRMQSSQSIDSNSLLELPQRLSLTVLNPDPPTPLNADPPATFFSPRSQQISSPPYPEKQSVKPVSSPVSPPMTSFSFRPPPPKRLTVPALLSRENGRDLDNGNHPGFQQEFPQYRPENPYLPRGYSPYRAQQQRRNDQSWKIPTVASNPPYVEEWEQPIQYETYPQSKPQPLPAPYDYEWGRNSGEPKRSSSLQARSRPSTLPPPRPPRTDLLEVPHSPIESEASSDIGSILPLPPSISLPNIRPILQNPLDFDPTLSAPAIVTAKKITFDVPDDVDNKPSQAAGPRRRRHSSHGSSTPRIGNMNMAGVGSSKFAETEYPRVDIRDPFGFGYADEGPYGNIRGAIAGAEHAKAAVANYYAQFVRSDGTPKFPEYRENFAAKTNALRAAELAEEEEAHARLQRRLAAEKTRQAKPSIEYEDAVPISVPLLRRPTSSGDGGSKLRRRSKSRSRDGEREPPPYMYGQVGSPPAAEDTPYFPPGPAYEKNTRKLSKVRK